MVIRAKAGGAWLNRHMNDLWVKRAQQSGYRSRAAYKLLEINVRDHLFKPGMMVIDLGASPGSWSQVARELIGPTGRVLALDRLPMNPLTGVEFILGDFTEKEVKKALTLLMHFQLPSLVMSDMAPNISGNSALDQGRIFHLAHLALEFCQHYLQVDGLFVVKVFQGEDFSAYLNEVKRVFEKVVSRKPQASRSHSKEIFLIGKHKI